MRTGRALALLFLFGFLFRPWLVMILMGVVHSFYPPLPAFGFFQSFAITMLVGALVAQTNVESKS